MNKTKQVQTLDIYSQYICYLKVRKIVLQNELGSGGASLQRLEKHRIIPGHANGTYKDSSNVLLVTFKEHTLAHFYRYLSFKQKGDLIAYRFMCNQTEQGRLLMACYAGQLGGTTTNKKNKANKAFFYNAEWQKKFGDKNVGKRNVESGFLAELNCKISKERPALRSETGKLGAKVTIEKQRINSTGMFSKKTLIQRKANLVRWGIMIKNVRVAYKKLSSDFIDYYLEYGNPFIKT